jgi:ribosome-binding protein aMBF1 (putative translation factor)
MVTPLSSKKRREAVIKDEKQAGAMRRRLARWTVIKARLSEMSVEFSIDDRELMSLVESRIDQIQQKLGEYQFLKHPKTEIVELELIGKIPTALVKARIALGWSLRDLAKATGMKAQHLCRYEKNGYSAIKLSKAITIMLVLQKALNERASALADARRSDLFASNATGTDSFNA